MSPVFKVYISKTAESDIEDAYLWWIRLMYTSAGLDHRVAPFSHSVESTVVSCLMAWAFGGINRPSTSPPTRSSCTLAERRPLSREHSRLSLLRKWRWASPPPFGPDPSNVPPRGDTPRAQGSKPAGRWNPGCHGWQKGKSPVCSITAPPPSTSTADST
jgi:hypothetical protein